MHLDDGTPPTWCKREVLLNGGLARADPLVMETAIGELTRRSGPKARRIGRRVSTPGLWIDWQPAAHGSRPRPLRGPGAALQQALIDDLSITGARVVVTDAEPLGVGRTVTIGMDAGAGLCEIRRVETKETGERTYGVEFIWLDSELSDKGSDLVTGDRGSLDEHWHRFR